MNKWIKLAAVIIAAGEITGCASIVSGSTQSISIAPMRNGVIDSKATCTATNKKGSWVTSGGGSVTIKKASDDLQVKCIDTETNQVGLQASPKSTQVGWAVANFFIWDLCTISCIIDFATGSIYEYPTQVQVVMPERPAAPPVAVALPVPAAPAPTAPAAAPAEPTAITDR